MAFTPGFLYDIYGEIPRRLSLIQYIDFISVPLNDEAKMGQLLRDLRSQIK